MLAISVTPLRVRRRRRIGIAALMAGAAAMILMIGVFAGGMFSTGQSNTEKERQQRRAGVASWDWEDNWKRLH